MSLEDKLTGQKQIKALELQRNQKREQQIEAVEGKLQQSTHLQELFSIRWRLS